MKVIVGESQRGPVISMVIVGMSVVLLGLTVFTNYPLKTTRADPGVDRPLHDHRQNDSSRGACSSR